MEKIKYICKPKQKINKNKPKKVEIKIKYKHKIVAITNIATIKQGWKLIILVFCGNDSIVQFFCNKKYLIRKVIYSDKLE